MSGIGIMIGGALEGIGEGLLERKRRQDMLREASLQATMGMLSQFSKMARPEAQADIMKAGMENIRNFMQASQPQPLLHKGKGKQPDPLDSFQQIFERLASKQYSNTAQPPFEFEKGGIPGTPLGPEKQQMPGGPPVGAIPSSAEEEAAARRQMETKALVDAAKYEQEQRIAAETKLNVENVKREQRRQQGISSGLTGLALLQFMEKSEVPASLLPPALPGYVEADRQAYSTVAAAQRGEPVDPAALQAAQAHIRKLEGGTSGIPSAVKGYVALYESQGKSPEEAHRLALERWDREQKEKEQRGELSERRSEVMLGLAAENLKTLRGAQSNASAPVSLGDPTSSDILSQTGLSVPAFSVLTGQAGSLPRDAATRKAAMREAGEWARSRGVDISVLASQYRANNDVLKQNTARLNNTLIMEGEVLGTIDNLQAVVKDADLSRLNMANVIRIWSGQQVNDGLAQQYATHLQQLRNQLSAYLAATQGRSGNQILLEDQREAERVIRNGVSTGSLTGLSTAIANETEKMKDVMERSVDRATKNVWSLFGVGQNYKPKFSPRGQQGSAPGGVEKWDFVNGVLQRVK